jgi:hypothetical protein
MAGLKRHMKCRKRRFRQPRPLQQRAQARATAVVQQCRDARLRQLG